MSTIYKFQDTETVLTCTTTSILTSTDVVLVNSVAKGGPSSAQIGVVSALAKVTSATAASTATNITSWGVTQVTGNTSGTQWLLDPPPAVGIYKTIITSSSSGILLVTTASTATANFVTTGTALGTTLTFTSTQGGVYVELVSLSTALWALIGQPKTGLACT